MRGHLEQRGKGVWRAKAFVGRDPNTGQRKYLTRTIRGTKREAEEILDDLVREAREQSGAVVDGTVADLAAKWLDLNEDRLSPTTARGYRRVLDRHLLPAFGKRKVRSLRPVELDEFYARLLRKGGEGGRALAPRSVLQVHSVLRRLLNQAVKWGWCVSNPANRATPPRTRPHEFRIPAPDDVVALIDAAASSRDPYLALFIRLAVVTGARRGELCALRWTDIDWAGSRLTIARSIVDGSNENLIEKGTKTHASRRIVMDTASLAALKDHRTAMEERAGACGVKLVADGFVLSDAPDCSAPWRPGRVTLAFGRLCEKLELTGVRLHDLRHFAATRMLVAGVPVKTVSGRLGHVNAATTLNVYAHFLESSDADAADVLSGLLEAGAGAVRSASADHAE